MSFGTDNEGRTVWHLAATRGQLETIKKLWELAENNVTIEDINNNLLFGTDNEGWTVWYWAAERGHLESLKKLWDWAK